MSKPHIVFLVAEDWYFCLHWLPVARAVRDAGYRVTVVTKTDQHADEIRNAGLALVPFDLGRGRFNLATETVRVFRLARLLRHLKPDLTHHIGIKAIATGSYAARRAGVGASINLFAGLGYLFASKQKRVRALRKVLRPLLAGPLKHGSSRVETLNQDDCDRLAADGWIDPERTTVLPGSGIDLERFTPMPPPDNAVVTLAVVARMIRIKGIDLIVEAVRRVQAAGTPCRLLLVGKPDPANPSSYSVEDLERWGSLPGIEWRGHVEDVRTIWREADIAILASLGGEGVPVTLLESSACCRPAIATNTPGCRDIVLNNSTGLLAEPSDLLSLVDATQVLVADKNKRLRFGSASRHLVETGFTSHRVASMILQDYGRLGLEP
ncbi:MAG: glycosyltransferase family 4 protein [Pseudomonadota bacterium]